MTHRPEKQIEEIVASYIDDPTSEMAAALKKFKQVVAFAFDKCVQTYNGPATDTWQSMYSSTTPSLAIGWYWIELTFGGNISSTAPSKQYRVRRNGGTNPDLWLAHVEENQASAGGSGSGRYSATGTDQIPGPYSFSAKFIDYIVNPQDADGTILLNLTDALTAGEETEWDGILAAHDGSTSIKAYHHEIFKLCQIETPINNGASWISTPAGMLDPAGLATKLDKTAVHIILQYTCFGSDAEVQLIQRVANGGSTSNIITPVTLPNTAPDGVTDVWVPLEIPGTIGQLGFNGLCEYFAEFRNNTSQNFKVRDVMCEFTEQ